MHAWSKRSNVTTTVRPYTPGSITAHLAGLLKPLGVLDGSPVAHSGHERPRRATSYRGPTSGSAAATASSSAKTTKRQGSPGSQDSTRKLQECSSCRPSDRCHLDGAMRLAAAAETGAGTSRRASSESPRSSNRGYGAPHRGPRAVLAGGLPASPLAGPA
ncbi:unnamed protein product [Prorocentrum cordatum]|uniref:Uncharacterized protein n=1 Tax=Prorocentrum cordatum TaxID=2364126 RepID=A0ABN9W6B5_9DINO|nr:unnamed protein product [Polarella glacialis]